MPKVYLTADQRLAARYDAMAQRLADGLAVYKCRNRLRNRDIGRALGIGTKPSPGFWAATAPSA